MFSRLLAFTGLCIILLFLPVVVSAPVENKCTRPSIRREWRRLSDQQRTAYHNAVKCIKGKEDFIGFGSQSKSILDKFTYVHYNLRKSVHHVASFLPWHRWFLEIYHNELKKCGYTGPLPYWDWTRDSGTTKAFMESEIFHPFKGFGSIGITKTCVRDGPYAGMTSSFPKVHCLTRGLNLSTAEPMQWSPIEISQIMAYPDFLSFWNRTERNIHDKVHNAIGGDMLEHYSPNEPLFYLHHAQIDRMWTIWQGRNRTRLSDYTGNFSHNTAKNTAFLRDIMTVLDLGKNRTVESVMNTRANGLCYTYDDEEDNPNITPQTTKYDHDVVVQ